MRVLVVEDEIKMASLIRRGLRSEGLAAGVAIKGEEARWLAGSTGYDAIVLDVMLPGIDGFETCRRLRTDGAWSPVLMLTARGAAADPGGRARRARGGRVGGGGRRARARRRRLPDQALLVQRAPGAAAGIGAAGTGRAPGRN